MAGTLRARSRLGGQAADTPARRSLCASPRLPGTAERVATSVSHRKQTTGYLSTRHSSRRGVRPITERITRARETPALPERAASASRDHSLVVEAPGFSPAKEQHRQTLYLSFTLRVAEGRCFTLTKEALTRLPRAIARDAKFPPSKLEPPISNFQNLIGTRKRLETHVSRRKQTLGCTSNRYRSQLTFALNSDAALPRELSLFEN
jgi:hypothetical protein